MILGKIIQQCVNKEFLLDSRLDKFNTVIQRGHNKLIKSESKNIYDVTKDLFFIKESLSHG